VKDALQALEVLTERDPSHAAGQFILGICYQVSGRFTDASERFQLAKVLAPKDPRPCQNRGNMLLVLNRPKEAHAEFTSAIRRDPNHAAAYYYRALSDVRLGRLPDAFADLAQAAKGQEMNFRALLLRAQLHDRKKDSAAAKADRAEAERTGPQDEADYVARGLDRSSQQDYVGALADFTKSTEVNPRYLHGWQNQANILSERLHQTEKALDPLDKALQLSAEFAPALAGKAVLLARLGQRPEAHKIMTQALAKNEDPMVLYQAACVYSLTSAKQAEDKTQALAFLRQALRNGFADFKMIAEDSDVDAIRKMPGFAAAVTSAKELQKK
jgi:tetratricopeptide (TPR) repeat protein